MLVAKYKRFFHCAEISGALKIEVTNIFQKIGTKGISSIKVGNDIIPLGTPEQMAERIATSVMAAKSDKPVAVQITKENTIYNATLSKPEAKSVGIEASQNRVIENEFKAVFTGAGTSAKLKQEDVLSLVGGRISAALQGAGENVVKVEIQLKATGPFTDIYGDETGKKDTDNLALHAGRKNELMKQLNELKNAAGKTSVKVGDYDVSVKGSSKEGVVTILMKKDGQTIEADVILPTKKEFNELEYKKDSVNQNYLESLNAKNQGLAKKVESNKTEFFAIMNAQRTEDVSNETKINKVITLLKLDTAEATAFKALHEDICATQRAGKITTTGKVETVTVKSTLEKTDPLKKSGAIVDPLEGITDPNKKVRIQETPNYIFTCYEFEQESMVPGQKSIPRIFTTIRNKSTGQSVTIDDLPYDKDTGKNDGSMTSQISRNWGGKNPDPWVTDREKIISEEGVSKERADALSLKKMVSQADDELTALVSEKYRAKNGDLEYKSDAAKDQQRIAKQFRDDMNYLSRKHIDNITRGHFNQSGTENAAEALRESATKKTGDIKKNSTE